MSKPRYTFFDEVRVEPRPGADPELEALRGRLGTILGLPLDDDDIPYYYAVDIDDLSEAWEIDEADLVGTGGKRPDPWAGGTITRVSPDGTVLGETNPAPPE